MRARPLLLAAAVLAALAPAPASAQQAGAAPPQPPSVRAFSGGFDGVGVTALSPTCVGPGEYRFYRVRDGAPTLAGRVPTPDVCREVVFADPSVPPGGSATYRATVVDAGGESALSGEVTGTVPVRPVPSPGPVRAVVVDALRGRTSTLVARELEVAPDNLPGQLRLRVSPTTVLSLDYPATGLPLGTYGAGPAEPSRVQLRPDGDIGRTCPEGLELTVRQAALRADGRPYVLDLSWRDSCERDGREHGELRYDAERGVVAAVSAPSDVTVTGARIGVQTPPQQVSVRNDGTGEVAVGPAQVTGLAGRDWRVVASTCTGTLPVGGTCTVDVALTASAGGRRDDELTVPDGTPLGRRVVQLLADVQDVPTAPTRLLAVPAVDRVQLTWSAPTTDGGSPVRGYVVRRSDDGSPFQEVGRTAFGGFDDLSVRAGGRHAYEVVAENALGRGAAATTGALPAVSARELIASVSGADGAYRLRRVPLDGGARLEQGGPEGEQDTPAVSPSRRQLAYAVPTADGSDLYVADLDTVGVPRRLTSGADDSAPVWSPDGSVMAFVRYAGDVPVLHTVPSAGGTPTAVPGGRGYDRPSFLPDGRRVVATRDGVRPALHVVPLAGGSGVPLRGGEDGFDPAVSPDGRTVAFARLDSGTTGAAMRTSIRTVPLAGGTAALLADEPGVDVWPAWAPDGRAVFFQHADLDAEGRPLPSDLFVVDVAGGAATTRNVTRTPDRDETEPVVHDGIGTTSTAPPSVPAQDGVPRLSLSATTVSPGTAVSVRVQAAPGSLVELLAYSRPSTTYGVVRKGVVGEAGTLGFSVTPGTNTRLYVRAVRDGTASTSASLAVSVRTSLSLSVVRRAPRDYVLQGRLLPRRGGQLVSLYRRSGGRDALLSQTRSDSSGTYRVGRRLAPGTYDLVARTGKTPDNEPGSSPVVRVRVS